MIIIEELLVVGFDFIYDFDLCSDLVVIIINQVIGVNL